MEPKRTGARKGQSTKQTYNKNHSNSSMLYYVMVCCLDFTAFSKLTWPKTLFTIRIHCKCTRKHLMLETKFWKRKAGQSVCMYVYMSNCLNVVSIGGSSLFMWTFENVQSSQWWDEWSHRRPLQWKHAFIQSCILIKLYSYVGKQTNRTKQMPTEF